MKLLKIILDLFRGGRSPAKLAAWLDVPEAELCEWQSGVPASRADSYSYSEFTIPKRRGGERRIEAPSDALKALQRRILQRLLNPLKFHPAATGFVPGRSIVDHARPHVGQGAVINIDLADFFPSIQVGRVREAFRVLGWNRAAADILANLCTHNGHLPQGAPTSPALSNLVCRRMDARFDALARKCGGHYTRYADDLTFSFPGFGSNRRRKPKPKGQPLRRRPRNPSRGLLRTIRQIVEGEGFTIQRKKKVRVQRPHQRQTAAGLLVNRAVNLPRRVRRGIRAMQHRARLGQLPQREREQLRGWESLAAMVVRQRGRF